MRRVLPLIALVAGASLALADTPPFRGWHRASVDPLGPGEWYEDTTLPNGARVRMKVAPNGQRSIVAVAPEPFRLAKTGGFPDEKRYQKLIASGALDEAATVLDKVLTSPESGRLLVRPPWDTSVWVNARTLARARLLGLPPAAHAAWRKLRDTEGCELLAAARRAGDPWELTALLARYPVASDAPRATVAAGDLFLEQGDLAEARRAWERARRDYGGAVDLAAIESRIECALLLEAGRRAEAPVRDDPARSAHAALGVVPPGRLRPLWHRRIEPVPHPPSRLPCALAVAHREAAFIHDAHGVTALELETGRLLWRTKLARILGADAQSPSTVAPGDEAVACVRGRRRAYLLERSTGRIARSVDVAKDLAGGLRDRIDAAACDRGRLYLLATLSGDRLVLCFDRDRGELWRSELWPGSGTAVSLLAGREGVFVLADGGLAALDPSGDVKWARTAEPLHPDPGASCERALARAGDALLLLGQSGLMALDAASGARRSSPALPPDLLVLAAGDAGPVFVNPAPPRGDPQVLAIEKERALIVARLDAAALPAWQGVVADGVVWVPGDRDLVGIELATGRELGRRRFERGPGRLSAAGSVVLATRDDEVVAYACRPAAGPLPAAPEDPRALVDWLSARDPRARELARARLRALGAKARPALTAALEAPSAEAREAARELLPELGLRERWTKAIAGLALDVGQDDLLAPSAAARLRAIRRAHGGDKDPTRDSPELVQVLRTVLARDDDPLVRAEALAWLVARDTEARTKVCAVLFDDEDAAGREAAAEALVNAESIEEKNPAHEALVNSLSSGRDDVRGALYLALLRHGGPREKALVEGRVVPWKDKDGKDRPVDMVADAMLKRFGRERRHPRGRPAPPDANLEADEQRRALLERVKLGD